MSEGNDAAKSQGELFTLDVKQNSGELIKPSELIELRGGRKLTLPDRRIYNMLLANAFGPNMAQEGRQFTIPFSDLRGNNLKGERILDSLDRLRHTDVMVECDDGEFVTVQLLGMIKHAPLKSGLNGTLTYSFVPELLPILRDSQIFARLELSLLVDFATKYGITLYEMVGRRVRMSHTMSEVFEINDFRDFLGVVEGKLTGFADLRRRAIDPAVAEVNAIAPFSCSVEIEKKIGKKVTHLRLYWWTKSIEERKEQYRQRQLQDAANSPDIMADEDG